jgi:hypothetical protein
MEEPIAPFSSWFGESIGHYEGDTLIVDTIGLTDRTFIDDYHARHGQAPRGGAFSLDRRRQDA